MSGITISQYYNATRSGNEIVVSACTAGGNGIVITNSTGYGVSFIVEFDNSSNNALQSGVATSGASLPSVISAGSYRISYGSTYGNYICGLSHSVPIFYVGAYTTTGFTIKHIYVHVG